MRVSLLILPLFLLACEDVEGPSSIQGQSAGAAGSAGISGSSGQGGAGQGGTAGASGQGDGGSAGANSAGSGGEGGAAGAGGEAVCGEDPVLPEEKLIGSKDPTGGVFTLEEALAGLPEGPGPLRAIMATDQGELTCELRPDLAPTAVANFVGLARGTRPFKDPKTKKWTKRRFYDGLTFHRVIPGFVAQGGDPLGTGFGGPGYSFADEITELTHVAGALAYANSGANTNGSQFYVTEAPQPALDGGYTVFGVCTPVSVVTALTSVPRDDADKPLEPLLLQSVKITRCAP